MEKPTSHAAKRDQSHDNSTAAQCDLLEAEIRRHPVSTIYARDKLDILMPAARVFQLRYERGLNIHTHWKTEPTACGKDHRVAEYVLLSGKWKGEAA
jgi:hypothetical protein